MTGVVQFVEIDVPHCALTYSQFPCRAQLDYEGGGAPPAVYWNNGYARRLAGLSGAADGKLATGSFWFRTSDLSATQTLFAGTTTLGGTTTRFSIRLVAGRIRITAATTAGTTTLDIRMSANLNDFDFQHILFSFDLSNSARRHIYVDDVSALAVTTFNNNNIDYTLADWSFGGLPNGSELSDFSSYSQFWLRFGTYMDLSVEANRRLFIDPIGRPVWLGDNGEIPTGSAPIVFFSNGADGFEFNQGTGGGFTYQSGSPEDTGFATGSRKCFNSLGTCQDIDNFSDDEDTTFRFSEMVAREFVNEGGVGSDVTTFPFIKSIDYQPAIVSLEGEIGQRATLKVVFRDAPNSDQEAAFDKYPFTRGYNAYERGTFWGKFRARNPYMRGRQIRLYIGEAGQSLDSLEARYFVIDSMAGPTPQGEFTITAQDILKFASGDRVVAPRPSNGFLTSDIGTGDITGTTIGPPGILDAEYGNGYACIGGSEVVYIDAFSGDNANISQRGSFNTEEQDHNGQDRLQVCLRFDPQDPADVIAILLIEFAGIWDGYIPIDDWHIESAAYLAINISLLVTEPTPVDKLLTEILEATGSALWWDDVNGVIRWQVIRSVPATADRYTEENVLTDTLEVSEQPEKRVSQVIVYFGQINPTIKVDETRNYRSTEVVTDFNSENLEGGSALKIIYARAIAAGGRAVANRIATRYLSRYVRAPRRFKFELLRFSLEAPHLGGGYLLGGPDVSRRSWPFQDDTGDWVEIPIQLTRVSSTPEGWQVEAEEMLSTAFGTGGDVIDPTNHIIIIDANQNNINLKDMHDSIYPGAGAGDTVNCYINGGVTIGSGDTGAPAFDVGGGWDGAVTINIFNGGRIQGCGGAGGNAGIPNTGNFSQSFANVGNPGGTAFYTPGTGINLENNGQIWGGGGGGGGTFYHPAYAIGGGGGSGTNGGAGGGASGGTSNAQPGQNGSASAGGKGGLDNGNPSLHGGSGGGPGQGGATSLNTAFTGQQRAGGAAGAAIDGISAISLTGGGDIQGSQIN